VLSLRRVIVPVLVPEGLLSPPRVTAPLPEREPLLVLGRVVTVDLSLVVRPTVGLVPRLVLVVLRFTWGVVELLRLMLELELLRFT
jgi:hypothetical protein